MRWILVGLLFAGCVVPNHLDEANWQQDNLYQEWASPDRTWRPDVTYASLPFAVDQLDAAWGVGNYALTRVEYKPPGDWHQGFMLDAYQAQGLLENPSSEVDLFADFLAQITRLDESERQNFAQNFFATEEHFVEVGDLPGELAIEQAWQMGELTSLEIGHARVTSGEWKFDFVLATKSEERGRNQDLKVDSAGFAHYMWFSSSTHSDEESNTKLRAFLADEGLGLIGEPTWQHGPREYD